jgi:predicted solute-binding protein
MLHPTERKFLSSHLKESDENLLIRDETLLVVDDEEGVTDVGRQMLERLGYKVLIARGSRK